VTLKDVSVYFGKNDDNNNNNDDKGEPPQTIADYLRLFYNVIPTRVNETLKSLSEMNQNKLFGYFFIIMSLVLVAMLVYENYGDTFAALSKEAVEKLNTYEITLGQFLQQYAISKTIDPYYYTWLTKSDFPIEDQISLFTFYHVFFGDVDIKKVLAP
jgi:hypothetical protein